MSEVIDFQRPQINESKILNSMQLVKNKYFIISIHREENVSDESNFNDFINTIKNLKNHYSHRIIVSTHPKTKKKLESMNIDKIDGVEFLKPFGFNDYIKLQENALCVISDSGTITEEASILNIRAITIRNSHERPEGMDNGVLIMSGLKKDKVLNSIETLILQSKENFNSSLVDDYSYYISKKDFKNNNFIYRLYKQKCVEKNKLKIIVLGSEGMAGHIISKYLSLNGHEVINIARKIKNSISSVSLDLLNFEDLEKLIVKISPEFIINCAGILNDKTTQNTYNSIKINSLLPRFLELKSDLHNYKLIHLSTDCVLMEKRLI